MSMLWCPDIRKLGYHILNTYASHNMLFPSFLDLRVYSCTPVSRVRILSQTRYPDIKKFGSKHVLYASISGFFVRKSKHVYICFEIRTFILWNPDFLSGYRGILLAKLPNIEASNSMTFIIVVFRPTIRLFTVSFKVSHVMGGILMTSIEYTGVFWLSRVSNPGPLKP